MNNYVDIHSHILPGIDDGARRMEESIAMLEMAYEEGVRTIFATPHYGMSMYEINQEQCAELVAELNAHIRIHGALNGMKVMLGNELLYHSGITDEIKQGAARTLGDTDFVLIEFYENSDFTVLEACAHEMKLAGYKPIYAHIERYACLRDSLAKVERLRNEGVLIQVNAGEYLREEHSPRKLFAKKFDELDERAHFAWRLLETNMVDFIASDAHRVKVRVPVMKMALDRISEVKGEEVAHNLVINAQILG